MELYFKDNFFSAGTSQIMNETGEAAGHLDLKSAFGSSLDVYRPNGFKACSGKFRFMSLGKWEVSDGGGAVLGVLRARMSFMTKRFEYDAGNRGTYAITSPAFSKEYVIESDKGEEAAAFVRTSNWMQPGAFRLSIRSRLVDGYEWIAVVMGIHAIQRRRNSAG